MANVHVPGNGVPPDPQGSGTGNDYSTGKNFDKNRGAAASLPPVASWQVSDPGKGFHVKPDVLNQVAGELQDDISAAQTVLQELQGIGAQLQAAMGQWPTGQTFGYMVQDALTQVEQIHQKLIQAHSNVVQNLQTTAAQYGATEAANTATVNTVGQQNPPTSSTVQAS
ncbi:MAG: type VII secretion target [Micromonosporaceae bacterium]